MKTHRLPLRTILLAAVVCFSAAAAFAQTPKLPAFKKNEDYGSVRTKMLQSGWKPFHAEGADACMTGDARCEGRPEMEACAGTGMANCRFLWKKDDKTVGICTVGEEAVYSGMCN